MDGLHAGVHPPVARHGAEGEGPDASPLRSADSDHAAPQCKPRSISPDEPDTVVNGFIDHLPSVSPADTSFACFIAGEGQGG